MSREIDVLIAEHVMGWTWWKLPDTAFWKGKRILSPTGAYNDGWCQAEPTTDMTLEISIHGPRIPNYSSDIAAAWQVVDKIPGTWKFEVNSWQEVKAELGSISGWIEKNKSMPLAICLAALIYEDVTFTYLRGCNITVL